MLLYPRHFVPGFLFLEKKIRGGKRRVFKDSRVYKK